MLLLQAFIASLAFKTFLKNVYHLRDHHTELGYEDEKKITFWYEQIWLFTSSHLGLSDSKQFVAKLLKQKIAEYQNWICSSQTLLIEIYAQIFFYVFSLVFMQTDLVLKTLSIYSGSHTGGGYCTACWTAKRLEVSCPKFWIY